MYSPSLDVRQTDAKNLPLPLSATAGGVAVSARPTSIMILMQTPPGLGVSEMPLISIVNRGKERAWATTLRPNGGFLRYERIRRSAWWGTVVRRTGSEGAQSWCDLRRPRLEGC